MTTQFSYQPPISAPTKTPLVTHLVSHILCLKTCRDWMTCVHLSCTCCCRTAICIETRQDTYHLNAFSGLSFARNSRFLHKIILTTHHPPTPKKKKKTIARFFKARTYNRRRVLLPGEFIGSHFIGVHICVLVCSGIHLMLVLRTIELHFYSTDVELAYETSGTKQMIQKTNGIW